MKKILWLRPWASLSEYEMDYVHLLRDEFDLRIVTVGDGTLGGIPQDAVRLRWPDEFLWKGRRRSLMNGFYSRVLGRRYHMPALARVLDGADFVQAGEASSEWSYQAARMKKRFGYRLLLSVSENQPILEGKTSSKERRIRFTMSQVDHVFAIPSAAKHRIEELGFPSEHITVIGHGVDCERFSPEGRERSSRARPVVGFLGRFGPEKGLDILLEAARGIDADFVFQGAGALEDRLRSLASPNVRFLPPVGYSEVHRFYAGIDLFVLPSVPLPGLVEQFGFVLIEAMAAGVPIVASAIGGIPEVLGDAGVLVPAGDAPALRSAIESLLRHPDRRTELSTLGRERALKHFGRHTVAEKMRGIFRRLSIS